LPSDCDCSFVYGYTYELAYNALLSVPTYRCVYSLKVGHWGFTLTITNTSPDQREFELVAGTDSGCAYPGAATQIGFEGIIFHDGANQAIAACEAATLYPTLDPDNCYCGLIIHIGGGSTASNISVSASPIP